MEVKTIKLLFEDEVYMHLVSKIIDNDKAFLYSLLRLIGCNKYPDGISIKLGMYKKEEEK